MKPRIIGFVAFTVLAGSQATWAQPSRIAGPIDNTRRIALRGHVHPEARAEFDQGRVSGSLTIPYMTLTFAPSASQAADLTQLLADQQNPSSPQFHQWLTPEQYADRFGASAPDVARAQTWLTSQGLAVISAARGRTWIAFSGAAAQVEAAFQTEIHQYVVNGETHFANSTDPTLPAAFQNLVQGVRGLHDFHAKPSQRTLNPAYTTSKGSHYIAPDDFATLYNLNPLYKAGVTGAGQKMAVAGQTRVNLSDIQSFRTEYGLSSNDPQLLLIPGSIDPGISTDDLPEADLDIEWAGAIARDASVIYVYSRDVMSSVQYAIDQNLAPVVTVSYGLCELEDTVFDMQDMRSWAQQANAQGITWVASSGDAGGADCNDPTNSGLAVDTPASIPEVTGIGGTTFTEGSGQYWGANGSTKASALSYIPETTWNDSAIDGSPSAGGGGVSVIFPRPSWQVGAGVPGDNARHVPDISFSASADHDGYLVTTGGSDQVYGGTSVPTPAFGGVVALLNQYLVQSGAIGAAGLGNVNPNLYALAQSHPVAFHDIATGDNMVTVACSKRRTNCNNTAQGYTAAAGYDQATGLGSVDVSALAAAWSGAALSSGPPVTSSHFQLSLLSSLNAPAAGDVVFIIATVTSTDGSTPTGVVTFQAGGTVLGSAQLAGSAGSATATVQVQASQLAGNGIITASYGQEASASVTVSVTGAGSGPVPSIAALVNGASLQTGFAPGGIMTVFGSQLALAVGLASNIPLPVSMNGVAVTINGVAAPLYYVGPGQLNIQIPYETPVGSVATLEINNNGQLTSQSFRVAAEAPGIFTTAGNAPVPTVSAAAGQIATLYVTGTGSVSPAVSTGGAPAQGASVASLPAPLATPVTVTVGGKAATIQFVGIPPGEVGAAQINYQIPSGLAAGAQPVIVSIGGVSSPAATITITN
ncbi:MAG TPA: protease pro-enzyme activation domain-containing protein [Bryobacteraceae bacterium]|jgi:uncharacterized protein (TIGR03437 family)